jgi:NADPH:quinone reductase-like Zn-dependent oxidoreductase
MRVMRVVNSVSPPSLVEADGPEPQAGRGELLVRVHAAGVTPTELDWYPTSHRKSGEKRTGAVPGHEFSGVIAAVGDQVTDLAVGQEVYGMNDWFTDGATAEYCITQPHWVAPKPRNLTHTEAASVPIGALTAWQGLFDRGNLQAGERVLIHGGAGGVGVFAVQLARWRGAHVVATASARNLEFVASLGAGQTIDYRAERFEDIAREIDVVFNAVGGDTLQRSLSVLRPGGAHDHDRRRGGGIQRPSIESGILHCRAQSRTVGGGRKTVGRRPDPDRRGRRAAVLAGACGLRRQPQRTGKTGSGDRINANYVVKTR